LDHTARFVGARLNHAAMTRRTDVLSSFDHAHRAGNAIMDLCW
jgi:hypothetical protein